MDAKKTYRFQVENHRRINHSLDVLEASLRHAIALNDRNTQKALFPLYILLLGACAEARLLKVLMEPSKFSQAEVTHILSGQSQRDKWHRLIEVSFLKRESKLITEKITEQTLNRTAWHHYKDLTNLIDNELKVIIELRNKLAHGQWEFPFTNWEHPFVVNDLKVSTEYKKLFNTENLLTMILKRGVIDKFLDIIRDLGISKKAYPRDFDKYYKRIQSAQIQIKTKSYDKYKDSLVNKYNNGVLMRQAVNNQP